MEIEFDSVKRDITLRERGLDFADAAIVFARGNITIADERFDYGETRYVTYGWRGPDGVAVVWTPRGNARRVISMRRMHKWEIEYVGLD